MMYYITFLVILVLSRKPVERFIDKKKWGGFEAMFVRAWVIYTVISLNDLGWHIWR